MTELMARILFPFSLVVSIALWIKGYAEVGDGFSAGAVAGLGAIVQYVCLDYDEAQRRVGARWAWHFVSGGLLFALLLLLAPTFFGIAPVTHFPRPGEEVIKLGALEMHTALGFDGGVGLLIYGVLVGTFDQLFPHLRGGQP